MTFPYVEVALLASEALSEFGGPVIRRAKGAAVYSPETGAASASTADSLRFGAMFDFGSGQTQVRGSLVQAVDKRLLLDASGEALPTDLFVVNGKTYSVVSVGEVNPAGTRCLYDLHVRG